jgi:RHS repeat-associated protein
VNDALGRRIEVYKNSSLQSRFIYDEQNRLIAELNSSGNLVSHFVYGQYSHTPDYMIKSGTKYKMIHDHVGSIVRVVNSSTGSVASSITYDEFGNITTSSSLSFQPFGFAGGIRDDVTGFVRFGARDYDPLTGRWTSKDPILFEGGDTNLYGYVLQDPVNGIDPSGLNELDPLPEPLPTPVPEPVPEPNSQPTPPSILPSAPTPLPPLRPWLQPAKDPGGVRGCLPSGGAFG